jgi:L-rhamnose mutarotase
MDRLCLTLDLINDEDLIAEYENWHKDIWPEIRLSIISAGIEQMEIYRFKNRLMMIMEVNDDFDAERKSAMDSANDKVKDGNR